MKILVLGGGGREHALVWKLRQSRAWKKSGAPPGWRHRGGSGVPWLSTRGTLPRSSRLRKRFNRSDHRGTGTATRKWTDGRLPAAKLGHCRTISAGGAARRQQDFLERVSRAARHPTAKMYGTYDSPADVYGALNSVAWPVVLRRMACAPARVFFWRQTSPPQKTLSNA